MDGLYSIRSHYGPWIIFWAITFYEPKTMCALLAITTFSLLFWMHIWSGFSFMRALYQNASLIQAFIQYIVASLLRIGKDRIICVGECLFDMVAMVLDRETKPGWSRKAWGMGLWHLLLSTCNCLWVAGLAEIVSKEASEVVIWVKVDLQFGHSFLELLFCGSLRK